MTKHNPHVIMGINVFNPCTSHMFCQFHKTSNMLVLGSFHFACVNDASQKKALSVASCWPSDILRLRINRRGRCHKYIHTFCLMSKKVSQWSPLIDKPSRVGRGWRVEGNCVLPVRAGSSHTQPDLATWHIHRQRHPKTLQTERKDRGVVVGFLCFFVCLFVFWGKGG